MRPDGMRGERPPFGGGEREDRPHRTLADISVTVWLTPENASFYTKNNFLYIKYGEKEQRVFLCRQFPFELEWEFISVMDAEKQEIGIVRNVQDFEAETEALLREELARRYYSPVILRIHSSKERYGFSYWKVKLSDGRTLNFTMQDTFRTIVRTGEDGAILLDVDGNRFVIKSIAALDRKSYRRIELYL